MSPDAPVVRHRRRKALVRARDAHRGLRFVETKLRAPAVRDDIVPRARLLDVLARAVEAFPLTLVSAPAGYGKTTLLASIGRVTSASVAWLSIDEDDNDPNVFAAALVASLRRVDANIGADAAELLPSAPASAARFSIR
jgi:LuxR family maltose regulon positive regulatory protein